ncbi:DUF58 domain-containing protein [Acidimangrovimonas sediminis]|uniref:DUF58 domain-containing protein n=1 Tax=Acidimangrovimonas sediminis TaxID=2056283 RepID=UPI001E616F9E|nr:DUF58 domain-containing protein [Acidimangrovimonas sediminis]
MSDAAASAQLRGRAETLGGALPPLLAEAEHLAASIMPGEHGRRRAGMGDEFWQYRPATPGDEARMIDWRRSARSDAHYVREKEWQAAQSVVFWVDPGRSMTFSGDKTRAPKGDRAKLLALAAAVLLIRAGERVGLAQPPLAPGAGRMQLLRLTLGLEGEGEEDYGAPGARDLPPRSRAVFLSDFLGDPARVEAALTAAADRGVRGALVQVLDPVEEAFPFDGRTIFTSMSGALRHETKRAGDLRDRYLERLAERKDRLAGLARATGWHYSCHHTGEAALTPLLWLYQVLEGAR